MSAGCSRPRAAHYAHIMYSNKALQQMLVDIKSDFQTLAANEPIFPLPVGKKFTHYLVYLYMKSSDIYV